MKRKIKKEKNKKNYVSSRTDSTVYRQCPSFTSLFEKLARIIFKVP